MNIIRMTGGLGNQMFAYALFLKFKSMGTDCIFDDFSEYEGHDNARPIRLDSFDIEYPKATRTMVREFTDGQTDILHKLKRKLTGRKSREYAESSCNYDPEILTKDNTYITGYFQTEKYFKDIEPLIKEAFIFNGKIRENAVNTFGKLNYDLKDTTAIHIRRGDYLNLPEVYGNICTDEYYKKAIRYVMKKNPDGKFLIFCNDTEFADKKASEWEKGFELKDGFKVSRDNDEDNGCRDMCLMSLCKNNIIANSSFSWWAAYLNAAPEKLVIAPARWSNVQDFTDIYTDEMIKL